MPALVEKLNRVLSAPSSGRADLYILVYGAIAPKPKLIPFEIEDLSLKIGNDILHKGLDFSYSSFFFENGILFLATETPLASGGAKKRYGSRPLDSCTIRKSNRLGYGLGGSIHEVIYVLTDVAVAIYQFSTILQY